MHTHTDTNNTSAPYCDFGIGENKIECVMYNILCVRGMNDLDLY